MITLDQLASICVTASGRQRATAFVDPLNKFCSQYEINTESRLSAFLGQVMHESGEFRYLRELASGDAYEKRKDLGNTQPGDGRRFKGRGLIQVTGRANYKACGDALSIDLITSPELLEQPGAAVASACWFWKSRALNELADSGDFEKITRRINGGLNGYDDRVRYWNRARQALGIKVA